MMQLKEKLQLHKPRLRLPKGKADGIAATRTEQERPSNGGISCGAWAFWGQVYLACSCFL